jgi:hypothetical protein
LDLSQLNQLFDSVVANQRFDLSQLNQKFVTTVYGLTNISPPGRAAGGQRRGFMTQAQAA